MIELCRSICVQIFLLFTYFYHIYLCYCSVFRLKFKEKKFNVNLHLFSAIEADTHLAPPSLPFNSLLNSVGPLPDVTKQKNLDTNAESAKVEECASVSSSDRANLVNSNDKPMDNEQISSLDQISVDQNCTPISDPDADSELSDRALRPSKIPVLKTKHTENSGNDASSSRSVSREDYDANRTLNVYSGIPTSPITGKKYRSPLSAVVKPLDRSKKLTNGNASSNSPCDNVNVTTDALTNIDRMNAPVQTNKNVVDVSSVSSSATVVIKSESNSGRDMSNHSMNDKSQDDTNFNTENFKEHTNLALNETPNSERKPKFKWMFGPHKNANVVGSLVCEKYRERSLIQH